MAAGALRDLGDRRSQLTENYKIRLDGLERQYLALPAGDALSDTLARLSESSHADGLVIHELAPGRLEPAGPFAVAAVELKTSGPFYAVMDWLEAVERSFATIASEA